MNLVILRGTLSSDPVERLLDSGSRLVQLQVSTPTDAGVASVPVAWFDPPVGGGLTTGDEIVVVGSVIRRFFRSASGTQSRTEVQARTVVRARNRRSVERALAVLDTLDR
jgi:hypothetical protein